MLSAVGTIILFLVFFGVGFLYGCLHIIKVRQVKIYKIEKLIADVIEQGTNRNDYWIPAESMENIVRLLRDLRF